MSVLVDTSGLYAVLGAGDDEHLRATAPWQSLLHAGVPCERPSGARRCAVRDRYAGAVGWNG